MAILQYQATVSLDGFIAGPGGDMGWLANYLDPNPAVEEVMKETGSLLVGRRTFGGDDPHAGTGAAGEPYGGGWSGEQIVLTHRPPAAGARPGITFGTDLRSAVAAAVRSAGSHRVVGVLGASIARQCLEAGLLAEVFVCVAPLLLGDGTALFHRAGGAAVPLQQVRSSTSGGVTNILYRVRR